MLPNQLESSFWKLLSGIICKELYSGALETSHQQATTVAWKTCMQIRTNSSPNSSKMLKSTINTENKDY